VVGDFRRKQSVKIKMLGDQVLIRPERLEKSAGGIIIPDKAHNNDRPSKGLVLEVGPGKYVDGVLVKPDVKSGDTVLFHTYPHLEIVDREVLESTNDKDSVFIVMSKEIVAVLEKGKK
jgi:chaperonin GroES